jgi:hypothetical protein
VVDNVGIGDWVGDGDGSGDVWVVTSSWFGGGGAWMGDTEEGTGERGDMRRGDWFMVRVGRRGIGAGRKKARGAGDGGGGSVTAWRSAMTSDSIILEYWLKRATISELGTSSSASRLIGGGDSVYDSRGDVGVSSMGHAAAW